VADSLFKKNKAELSGGGIYFDGSSSSQFSAKKVGLTIAKCMFEYNEAYHGGAIQLA
jgi:predicted outer membrane repeat protein